MIGLFETIAYAGDHHVPSSSWAWVAGTMVLGALGLGALRGLFAVAENYPQLKANENFLKLQTRISELEERIADRREFFNDDVNTYNTRIAQLPEVFLASFMALKPREMFKASEFVDISLNNFAARA